ncbi:MAG: YfhO family protein [Oscillospiraceae bacterium]|nr:YfhO family protein [Oscillospiraceae bacterium]
MKLSSPKSFKWNYTLLAFFVPVLCLFVMMIARSFEPFGPVTMLYSDMYHQYFPFFVNFREALLSGDSLLYNWSLGMGMDYLGLISYYLASPLNLFSVLVPESLLLEYFSLLMPIKLGLAGMFFAIFLKKLFRKDDFSIVVFGSFYALCAWALGYSWNVMWLDTFALLPLVALGAISLLENRKFLLYTLTLFLSVFTNYYIGLFTCIFMVLLFVCYQICRWNGFKKLFCDLGVMALYSALAIGMTAILEIPAFAALQNTQSSVNEFPKGFKLNIADQNTWLGLLDAMRQVAGNMNGAIAPSYKEGLPNLYCGIFANILAFLFLTCRQIKLREKLCCVFLLLFFNVSFIIRQLDYIWHGFHFTNMIPYRFSFLYSFVMLYMAYRAYLLRNRFRLWQILAAGVLAVSICLCVNDWTNIIYWAYNGIFLLLYLSLFLYVLLQKKPKKDAASEAKRIYIAERKSRRRFSGAALLALICMELVLNIINFGVDFTGTTVTNYPRGTEQAASMIRYMKEHGKDELFYRAEVTHSQTLNDGALNGYNGISAFTSSANVNVTKFMKALGYGAKETYNRYCYEESSPVANLFLNLKYMLERDGKVEENNYFDEVHHYGNVYLLENNAYLPLGFLANNQILNTSFSSGGNTFVFQNKLFRDATGMGADVWEMTGGNCLSVTGVDVTVRPQTLTGYCYYTAGNIGGRIIYRYVAEKDGLFCVDLNLPKKNGISFWKNGIELYNETYSIPQSMAVSQVNKGDIIEIYLTCEANTKSSTTIHAAILNEDIFRQGYDILSASTLQLTTFNNTYVEGTVNCNRAGVLYTSIPQDGNWTATVDGKPAQIAIIGDAMVGLLLSEGEHTVAFTYHNVAFSLGWKLSLACALILLYLYISIYKPQFKRGKYEFSSQTQTTERRVINDNSVTNDSRETSDS